MIKIIAVGIWVCIASLGSSYAVASYVSQEATTETKEPTYFVGLDYRKTEGITVPIIARNAIQGYVLASFVYTVDGEIANKLAVPPDPFILDEAFRSVYTTSTFDFEKPEQYDLAALTSMIRDAVNARYKQDVVHEVLIEQFDFLPKGQIGGEGLRQSMTAPPSAG
jgi:flagellar basal body-associated protein FliL